MMGKCEDCEFCAPDKKYGMVCAGKKYGEDVSQTLKDNKDCYSEGFEAFVRRKKKEEVAYVPGTKLIQLKVDGRKRIELIDKENKIISIKFSLAKEILADLEILRMLDEDMYLINGFFDPEPFEGGKCLVLK